MPGPQAGIEKTDSIWQQRLCENSSTSAFYNLNKPTPARNTREKQAEQKALSPHKLHHAVDDETESQQSHSSDVTRRAN
jgi:hypothetical protein